MSSSLQASPPPNQQHNDNAALNSSIDSQQFHTPSAGSTAMNTPLEYPRSSPNHESPSTPTATAANTGTARNRPGIPDILKNPPIPPPRTSSNNRVQTSEGGSSRHGKRRKDDGQRRGERERERGQTSNSRERAKDDMTSPAVKTRRKAPHSPEGPQRAASTREPRDYPSTALESRSEAAMGPSSVPTPLVKEGSTVIKRVVVTDPEVDITREQQRQAHTQSENSSTARVDVSNGEGADEDSENRHDGNSGSRRKETSFGDYVLGQTLGEGEFGKVRLGWKRDGSVQVAIKLIRRESLGNNPGRLPKIHREISILSGLSHPNIVRLHEMVQTDRHIGIILEYASGGELFDYILNHRHLKDNAARRLFAQLVSGVGYLHKKGIVHRDLKLENLLLDRNRNIIITDFGFANTFNPTDELNEEIEYNLTNREFVKQLRLDRPDASGMRRGDLMQTSCGSPCYAAPELVVSDSLYTGRKVDVWSCGVILYAMLAGYLPFDDDPANPDGDNINLLYKYIVTTPLTFPEFVTPHARDLLRRILVPDPRKRADLFEVARHSWLAEYANVVSHITSNTTNVSEIANTTVPSEGQQETPLLARSASVREPPKAYPQGNTAPIDGTQQGKASQPDDKPKRQRDAKRSTVQVEYVAPQSHTTRGDSGSGSSTAPHVSAAPTSSHINTKPASREPREISTIMEADRSKPLPKQPIVGRDSRDQTTYTSLADQNQGMTRPKSRDIARSVSELTGAFAGTQGSLPLSTRPQTGGSVASTSGKLDRSQGSYSQPVAPEVAATNVQGRLAQPNNGKPYNISSPMPMEQGQTAPSIGQPSTQAANPTSTQEYPSRGHKRSSTVSSIGEKLFGRSGSIFGGRTSQPSSPRLKPGKRYPPTSMRDPFPADESRPSMDSRRSISYAFRKQSDAAQGGRPRRFSLLPASLSLKSFTPSSKDPPPTGQPADNFVRPQENQPQQQQQQHSRRLSTAPASVSTSSTVHVQNQPVGSNTQDSGAYQGEGTFGNSRSQMDTMSYSAQIDRQFATLHGSNFDGQNRNDQYTQGYQPPSQGYREPESNGPGTQHPPENYNYQNENGSRPSMHTGRLTRNPALQKNNRKFADAYEYERVPSHHSGSSGAARKVMDFFRRRGKARGGEDR